MKSIDINHLKHIPHWAESLETADRCIALIRHKTDGTKNINNASVIVIRNNVLKQQITALFNDIEYNIPYNELSKI